MIFATFLTVSFFRGIFNKKYLKNNKLNYKKNRYSKKKEGKENKKKVASIIHYFLLPVLHPVL